MRGCCKVYQHLKIEPIFISFESTTCLLVIVISPACSYSGCVFPTFGPWFVATSVRIGSTGLRQPLNILSIIHWKKLLNIILERHWKLGRWLNLCLTYGSCSSTSKMVHFEFFTTPNQWHWKPLACFWLIFYRFHVKILCCLTFINSWPEYTHHSISGVENIPYQTLYQCSCIPHPWLKKHLCGFAQSGHRWSCCWSIQSTISIKSKQLNILISCRLFHYL